MLGRISWFFSHLGGTCGSRSTLLFYLAADHQIVINVTKVVFFFIFLYFFGLRVVGESGFQRSPELVKAIREFPAPTFVTVMWSFHGLCQQVGNFSDTLAPFLPFLVTWPRKDFVWEWTEQHKRDCKVARESLLFAMELSFNNPACPTSLHVDASRLRGVG
jgi:hypothetical protein